MPDLGMPPAANNDLATAMTLLSPLIGQAMGGFPAQFFPQQSVHDQMRQMEMQRQMQSMMGAQTATAAANFQRMLSGGGQLLGFTPDHPYSQIIGRDAGAAYPYVAPFMPRGLRSAMWGTTGDPTLAGGDFLGAFQGKLDPATGQLGYSGASAAVAANTLYERMASNPAMRGVKIDQLSQFLSLQPERFQNLRGLIGGDGMDRMQGLRDAGLDPRSAIPKSALGRMSANELSILGGDAPAGELFQKADAERLTQWATSQAELFKSLKDAFGPNAPIQQLFQAMKDLTQNNAQGLNPTQVADVIRQTKELGSMSGMGIGGIAATMGFLGNYASSQGMSTRGVGQAARGAAAYSTAFSALGYGAAHNLDLEKLRTMHGQLQVNAGNSAVAGQLGATLQAESAAGGFKEGTEAAQLAAALKAGKATYGPGNKSVFVSESDWYRIMKEGGADPDMLRGLRMQSETNKKKAIDAGLDATVRQLQFTNDVAPIMRQQIANDLGSQFGKQSGQAADAAIAAIMGMDMAAYANDPEARIKAVMDNMRAAGVKGDEKTLRAAAVTAIGGFEHVAASRGYGSGSSVKALFDPKLLQATRTENTRAQLRGQMAKAFSGVGGDDLWTRIVDIAMNADSSTSFKDVAAKLFNIVPNEELNAVLDNAFKETQAAKAKIDAAMADPAMFNRETQQMSAEGKRVIEAEKKRLEEALPKAMEAYRAAAEKAGAHPAAEPAEGSTAMASRPTEVRLSGTITFDGEEFPVGGTAEIA